MRYIRVQLLNSLSIIIIISITLPLLHYIPDNFTGRWPSFSNPAINCTPCHVETTDIVRASDGHALASQ